MQFSQINIANNNNNNVSIKSSSKSSKSKSERDQHPTLKELEEILSLPQNEWLLPLKNLKWKGNERINIEKWRNVLIKLKEPIDSIINNDKDKDDLNKNEDNIDHKLIYVILNIYITLITHSSRHTMHNFDVLSIESLEKLINLDDISILMIVLDVWNVFWHRSGGTMQFEHDALKKKIIGLCHNILQNEFTLQIPENLQQITKMSSLSVDINKLYLKQWTQFAQTIKIPKEYIKSSNNSNNNELIKQLKFDTKFNNDKELRIAINKELQTLKQQISLPSEFSLNAHIIHIIHILTMYYLCYTEKNSF